MFEAFPYGVNLALSESDFSWGENPNPEDLKILGDPDSSIFETNDVFQSFSPAVRLIYYLIQLDSTCSDIRAGKPTFPDESNLIALNYDPNKPRRDLVERYGDLDNQGLENAYREELSGKIQRLIQRLPGDSQTQFFENPKLVEDMELIGHPLVRK